MEIVRNACIDPTFIGAHRTAPTFFLRRRKLAFSSIVGALIHLMKKSLQIVCNFLGDFLKMATPVSKQAFSKARDKISHTAFIELNNMALQAYYQRDTAGLWKGNRILACDGSTARLPDSPETEIFFERWDRGGDNRSDNCPVMGRISEITDMAAGLIVSGRLAPWREGEQTLAREQLEEVVEKMKRWGQTRLLFVYDRGYPSKVFFQQHVDLGVDFLFRLPRRFNARVDELSERQDRDTIEKLYPNLPPLRILVIPLPNGQSETLITTLIDRETYDYEDFSALYAMRWETMEEGYKRQKIALELTNWSARSVLGVMQDFWATILVNNMISIGCAELEGPRLPENRTQKRINRRVLFGSLRYDVLATVTGKMSPQKFQEKFERLARRGRIPPRPDRHYARDGLGQPKRYTVYPRTC